MQYTAMSRDKRTNIIDKIQCIMTFGNKDKMYLLSNKSNEYK